jgi:hypothetical protein
MRKDFGNFGNEWLGEEKREEKENGRGGSGIKSRRRMERSRKDWRRGEEQVVLKDRPLSG